MVAVRRRLQSDARPSLNFPVRLPVVFTPGDSKSTAKLPCGNCGRKSVTLDFAISMLWILGKPGKILSFFQRKLYLIIWCRVRSGVDCLSGYPKHPIYAYVTTKINISPHSPWQNVGRKIVNRRLLDRVSRLSSAATLNPGGRRRPVGFTGAPEKVGCDAARSDMKIQVFGCSHHTAPVAVREQIAFGPADVDIGPRRASSGIAGRGSGAAVHLQSGGVVQCGGRERRRRPATTGSTSWPASTA